MGVSSLSGRAGPNGLVCLVDSFCFFFTRRRPFGLQQIRFRPAPQWARQSRPKSPSDLVLSISPDPPWKEMESIWGHLWLNGWKWRISLEFDACDIGGVGRVKSSPTR